VVAIILSAAAAEAFISELAEHISLCLAYANAGTVSPQVTAMAQAVNQVEDEKGGVLLKYLVASYMLSGQMMKRGEQPFQDFKALYTLRNDLMHFKPREKITGEAGTQLEQRFEGKFYGNLQQRGLMRKEPHAIESWFDLLQTKEMAEWACITAQNIVVAILDMIPQSHNDHVGPEFAFSAWRTAARASK
jgi:hypothetical protein